MLRAKNNVTGEGSFEIPCPYCLGTVMSKDIVLDMSSFRFLVHLVPTPLCLLITCNGVL